MDPPGKLNGLADVFFTKRIAIVSAIHDAGKSSASFWAKRRISQVDDFSWSGIGSP
jgi:hypothetical protein